MTEVFWTIVFGAGAIQGLFLGSVLLFGRNGNRRLGFLVAILLVIFAIAIFAQVLQNMVAPNLALLIAFLNINTELTVGPMYYLIVRSLVLRQHQFRSIDLIHFLPFLLGLAIWGSAWLRVDDHQRLIRFGFDTEFPVLNFMVFKAVILYSYFIASYRLLVDSSRRSRLLYAGRRSVNPTTLLRITIGLGCVPAVIYVITALEHLGYASDLNSDQIGSLLLVGIMFSVAWLLMFKPWVLSLKIGDTESRKWKRDALTLTAYLDQDKPWLDPELRSSHIARNLDWTDSHLSLVIRNGMNTTFQGLLSSHRLAEFDRLARDTDSQSRVVLELAFDAGFGSKAAFYRAFREAHDTTPTRYRNLIVQSTPQNTSQFSE